MVDLDLLEYLESFLTPERKKALSRGPELQDQLFDSGC